MHETISRRKLAEYFVTSHMDGTPFDKLVEQYAAYLVETGRTRESDLLVRTIEDVFAEHGTVIARVTSAHPLTAAMRHQIEAQIDAKRVICQEIVDPTVVGGVLIETPSQLLDATMKRKLLALRQAKV